MLTCANSAGSSMASTAPLTATVAQNPASIYGVTLDEVSNVSDTSGGTSPKKWCRGRDRSGSPLTRPSSDAAAVLQRTFQLSTRHTPWWFASYSMSGCCWSLPDESKESIRHSQVAPGAPQVTTSVALGL